MRISPLAVVASLITKIAVQSGNTANPPTTQPGFTVNAGSSSTFTWTPTTSGSVTLTLRNGDPSDLNRGTVLASGIVNSGSYTFQVPAGTVSGTDYTIQISSDSNVQDINYSDPITVKASGTVASASPSSTSSTTTSTTYSSTSTSSSSSNKCSTSSKVSSTGYTASAASHKSSSTTSSSSASTTGSAESGASETASPTGSERAPPRGASVMLNVKNELVAIIMGFAIVF